MEVKEKRCDVCGSNRKVKTKTETILDVLEPSVYREDSGTYISVTQKTKTNKELIDICEHCNRQLDGALLILNNKPSTNDNGIEVAKYLLYCKPPWDRGLDLVFFAVATEKLRKKITRYRYFVRGLIVLLIISFIIMAVMI